MCYGHKEIPLFDGRWQSQPGIEGPVRTGPRGARFWDFVNDGKLDSLTPPCWSADTTKESMDEGPMVSLEEDLRGQSVKTVDSTANPSHATRALSTVKTSTTYEFNIWRSKKDKDAYHRHITKVIANDPGKVASLARIGKITTYLDNMSSITEESPLSRRKNAYDKVRDWVLEMHHSDVRAQDLQQTQVVENIRQFLSAKAATAASTSQTNGRQDVWLEEELTAIMRKWARGDLLCSPKRGLELKQVKQSEDKSHSYYTLKKNWEHYQSAHYFGEGQLVNGQTWFSRLELMRDGAHGERYGGIAGTQSEGAYSVVMSHAIAAKQGSYANIDMGEVIEYMGTALKEAGADEDTDAGTVPQTTTACTATMKKSLGTGKPVRVIRKFKLSEKHKSGPENGYRYDGMYKVVGETLVSASKQEWRFRMERVPGQGPLRAWDPISQKKADGDSKIRQG